MGARMKVGDLIVDKEYPDEPGIILEKRDSEVGGKTYRVLNDRGDVEWFGKRYIENDCEVISESRQPSTKET
jgi:hypothetical protein